MHWISKTIIAVTNNIHFNTTSYRKLLNTPFTTAVKNHSYTQYAATHTSRRIPISSMMCNKNDNSCSSGANHNSGRSSTSTSTSTSHTSPPPSSSPPVLDIEESHKQAVLQKQFTYVDPQTGFMVFTDYAHLKRGLCCGNECRHCPYGWENVYRSRNPNPKGNNANIVRKIPRVRSGNQPKIDLLMDKIDDGTYFLKEKRSDSDSDDSDSDDSDSDSNSDDGDENTTSPLQPPTSTSAPTPPQTNTKSGGRYGGKHTTKNVPYTRTGDSGTSILITGERRSKDDIAFEAMGTVDELCSVVGVVHAEIIHHTDVPEELNVLQEWLLDVMSRLFDIGSHVAKPRKVIVHNDSDSDSDDDHDDNDNDKKIEQEEFTADGVGNGFDINHIDVLEEWIDRMTEELPELTHFILPTGTKTSAQLHVARCVCRRAERRLLPLVKDGVCDPNAGKYLNRLSDFFFTAARWSNFCEGLDEVQYKRPMRGARQRNRVTVKLREEKKVL